MTKKIFRSICLVAIAVLLSSLFFIMGVLYSYFSDVQLKQLRSLSVLAANAVEAEGATYFDGLSSEDVRITWIEADGKVKYDNKKNSEEMENHLEREEIKQALQTGKGESSRYSTTLTERQFYEAVRLSDGSILRLSVSQLSWWTLIISMMQPIIIVIVIAIGLSLFLAYKLSKNIVKPLNELNLDEPESNDTYEELSPLMDRICLQQNQLKLQWTQLETKKEEFEISTRNMSEGIILLNESGMVLSINTAALRILNISSYCIGKDLLLFNNTLQIQELLRLARSGEHSTMTIPFGECDYQINASPIFSDSEVSGISLIIFDITEKEKAERIRREFTANVSHELKTPLQSISGCAELLSNNMVDSKDVPKFLSQIYDESQRLISLVDDIISLSGLDEGIEELKPETVDIYELAELTVRNLTPVATGNNVTLSLSGESSQISGIPKLISTIVYNLCDNAIKYNRPAGTVSVTVNDFETCSVLCVTDTGIGIPIDQQDRVFERFYRVDKSHSKEVGGTGLGLSIVKHAAKIHNATIELKSIFEVGTAITITFPKTSLQ